MTGTLLVSFAYLLLTVAVVQAARLLRARFAARVKGAAGEAFIAIWARGRRLVAAHDIILPREDGRLTQIDHVVRHADGLLVIETKHYAGAIYGKADEPFWTQRLGGQRKRFQNPLRQNESHVEAVRLAAPQLAEGMAVEGVVVFTGSASLHLTGCEGLVYALPAFKKCFRSLRDNPRNRLLITQWGRLERAAKQHAGQRKEHLAQLAARHGAKVSAIRSDSPMV